MSVFPLLLPFAHFPIGVHCLSHLEFLTMLISYNVMNKCKDSFKSDILGIDQSRYVCKFPLANASTRFVCLNFVQFI